MAVTKAKHNPLFLLSLPDCYLSENPVNAFQLEALHRCVKIVSADHARIDIDRLRQRDSSSTLGRHRTLKIVVYNIRRNHFQKSIDGFLVQRLEGSKQTAVIFAEFQVGILNQVVNLWAGGLAPEASGSKHCCSNHNMKSANELGPGALVLRTSASLD